MVEEAKRDERVYVKHLSHGNSARISRTCRLVKSTSQDTTVRPLGTLGSQDLKTGNF
jgi:hypothetical protein